MLYKEIKEEYNNILNNTKILFVIISFSQNDFEEQLEENQKKYNVKSDDLVCVNGHIFYLKKDWQKIKEALTRKEKRIREEVIPNAEELKKAFIYEMHNHEYIISEDMHTILKKLFLSMDDYNTNENIKNIYDEAEQKYFDDYDN